MPALLRRMYLEVANGGFGFRTADGQMWDWDPNLCCIQHAPAPLGQSLAQWLTDWVCGKAHEGPYAHRAWDDSDCRNP